MPRSTKTAPPRLLTSEMIILPHEEHERAMVCVVTMATDDGATELALNVGVAEQLFCLLFDFLEKADPVQ